jgi:tRNA modification GTPase
VQSIHEGYVPGETIAAITTPPGEGAISVIRISGERAVQVADTLFSGKLTAYASHTLHYGQILGDQGEIVDDVVLGIMLAPRTYTGEDTIEISCHGGSIITRRALQRVLQCGARMARPGEFTLKAFLNGKIDLAQAEAVQELIAAKSELALDAASEQLHGRLSCQIQSFQKELIAIAAILEAWVDFPEEGIEFRSIEEVTADLEKIQQSMKSLLTSYHDGRRLHDGFSLALVGAPNVGKSSLMNAIVDRERAIVTPIAGTTRDTLEEEVMIRGLNFRVCDTAGIRETDEVIEREGVRRSYLEMERADLVLFVLDSSRALTTWERTTLSQLPKEKTIIVWNKIDLTEGVAESESQSLCSVSLSAKEKSGLPELFYAIDQMIWQGSPPSKEEIVITSLRHKEALREAVESCDRVIAGLGSGESPEFLTFDVRQTLRALGKIIGHDITEDLLSSIFSQFCIGK